jgi:hypothetical protein
MVAITNQEARHAVQTFSRLYNQYHEFAPSCGKVAKLRINGSGRETPVADAATLIEIAFLLPGNKARDFRRAGADKVRRVLGGDVTLLDEIERRHAEIAGTEQEAFLLGASTSQAVVPADEPTPMQLYRLEVERVQAEKLKAQNEADKFRLEAPIKRMRFAHDWRQSLEQIGAFTVTDLMSYQQLLRTADPSTQLYLEGAGGEREALKEYTLSEYLQLEKGKVVDYKKLRKPGVALAKLYRRVAGKEPSTKIVECNGRATSIKAYTNEQIAEADEGVTGFTLMDQIIAEYAAEMDQNAAEWQENLVESARGWTGLDWTGLEPGHPML